MEHQMERAVAGPLEQAPTYSENHWTLQRETAEWCSLDCNSGGWRLRMHVGEFSVMAEGGGEGSNAEAVESLRSRLRTLGWSEVPEIRIRLKPDRRAGRR
jgi:hypothetical protein